MLNCQELVAQIMKIEDIGPPLMRLLANMAKKSTASKKLSRLQTKFAKITEKWIETNIQSKLVTNFL